MCFVTCATPKDLVELQKRQIKVYRVQRQPQWVKGTSTVLQQIVPCSHTNFSIHTHHCNTPIFMVSSIPNLLLTSRAICDYGEAAFAAKESELKTSKLLN